MSSIYGLIALNVSGFACGSPEGGISIAHRPADGGSPRVAWTEAASLGTKRGRSTLSGHAHGSTWMSSAMTRSSST